MGRVLESCHSLALGFFLKKRKKKKTELQTWIELAGSGEGECVDAQCSREAGEATFTHAAVLLFSH